MYRCKICHKEQSVRGECVFCGATTVAEKVFNLVFCADCHYAKHDNDKPTLWRCSNSNWYKIDDDFCSKGMKREAEE